MVKIIYIEYNGIVYEIDVKFGMIVMEGVCDNGVFGIDVDCGGVCVCFICYVYVVLEWVDCFFVKDLMEEDMLDFVYQFDVVCLWLICQLKVMFEFDGLVVNLFECQI